MVSFLNTTAFSRWGIPAALALYALCGGLLVAQRPGLHYDEALLVDGAVQMRHSKAEISLPHSPLTWACKRGVCFPVMGEGPYIGAVKDYLCLPLFAVFGPRAWVARVAAMFLAMIGIWGFGKLMAQQVSPGAGATAALILAVNPAYLNMTVFDNGVVAPMMAGWGLICAAVALYLRWSGVLAAFAIGAASGFAIYARANFLWTLVGAVVAAAIVFHRHLRIPLAHAAAIVIGGIVGGAPFLYYQYVSRGGTLNTMQDFAGQESLLKLLPLRLYWLADTLVSDGEHRVMWAKVELPDWQLWLFPMMVAIAAVVCVLAVFTRQGKQWRAAPFAVIAMLVSGAFLFTSHLPITEHHLIALVPWAVAVVVMACAFLQRRFGWGGVVSAALALVYVGCAGYWQFASVEGLRRTGGVGVWSNAMVEVARTLDRDYPGRQIKIMDWGFQTNLFVLMDGRLDSVQLTAPGNDSSHSLRGWTWPEEIREGGVFLVSGPHARTFGPPVESFLHAWNATRPVTHIRRFAEGRFVEGRFAAGNDATYAEILEIEPNSMPGGESNDGLGPRHQSLSMNDPAMEQLASGFYELQPGDWRWSKPEFSVRLSGPDLPGSPVALSLEVYLPAARFERDGGTTPGEKLGPITLRATVGGHALEPQSFSQPGHYTFTRHVPGDWLKPGANEIAFQVDKPFVPVGGDARALGVVVSGVALEAQ